MSCNPDDARLDPRGSASSPRTNAACLPEPGPSRSAAKQTQPSTTRLSQILPITPVPADLEGRIHAMFCLPKVAL